MEHLERSIAEGLLSIRAVFFRPDEPFTWASGIKSPVYCDNRLILTELRCGDEKTLALTLEMRKQRGDAGVGGIVEPAVLLVVFAEFRDRGVDIFRAHDIAAASASLWAKQCAATSSSLIWTAR